MSLLRGIGNSLPRDTNGPREQSCCEALAETVNSIFQTILDGLILTSWALQNACHYIDSFFDWREQRVFQGNIVCRTTNHAKFEDLPRYLIYQQHPFQVDSQTLDTAKKWGFTPEPAGTLTVQPHNGGHCFGNVAIFLKKWLEGVSSQQMIETFEGGTPLEGVIVEAAYADLLLADYCINIHGHLADIIESYPLVSFTQERKKWIDGEREKSLLLLDALEVYLKDEKHPSQGGFVEAMSNLCYQQTKETLQGFQLATLRTVSLLYEKHALTGRNHVQAGFDFVDLKIEKCCLENSDPNLLLRALKTVESGAYLLTMPVFDVFGVQSKTAHAIGITINPDGTCLILDSNIAIGCCSQSQLPATIGRLFTEYNGIDYSTGESPSFWTKFSNSILGRPNPPSVELSDGFDLYKVTQVV